MAQLKILKADGKPLVFKLEGAELTLGRHARNRIVVQSRHVSGEHAVLRWHESIQSYELVDLQSSNGTEVNGELITSIMLNDGDTIMFGKLVARYEQEDDVVELRPYVEAVKEREVLEGEKVELRCQLASLRAEIEDAEREIESIADARQVAIREAELAEKEQNAKVAAARGMLKVLEGKLAEEKERLQESVTEIAEARGVLDAVEEEIKAKHEESEKLEDYGKSLQVKIREGLQAAEEMERRRAHAKERLRAAEQEVVWKRNRLVELDRVVATREAILADLEAKASSIPGLEQTEMPEPPPPSSDPQSEAVEPETSLEDELTRMGISIKQVAKNSG